LVLPSFLPVDLLRDSGHGRGTRLHE
jgi:hypothetical protein